MTIPNCHLAIRTIWACWLGLTDELKLCLVLHSQHKLLRIHWCAHITTTSQPRFRAHSFDTQAVGFTKPSNGVSENRIRKVLVHSISDYLESFGILKYAKGNRDIFFQFLFPVVFRQQLHKIACQRF